ncbi:MAG TPA: superoxide dismutase [Bacteroidales bacterium]|nr:superoxide dismutase [Bacteroidales bacterium]
MKKSKILIVTFIIGITLLNNKTMAQEYTFPQLPYAYDALEPYIDAQTMEIHYSKHFKAYFDNFVKAATENGVDKLPINEIFARTSTLPAAVRNNGGGYYNHMLFWQVMGPNAGGQPAGDLLNAINSTFGSFDKFKADFENAAKTQFGSGWAWLAVDKDGKLFVSQSPNQDNPLMDIAVKKGTPILTLDVWEHAYYLKYQNRRPEYVTNFWNVVNWNKVAELYSEALRK